MHVFLPINWNPVPKYRAIIVKVAGLRMQWVQMWCNGGRTGYNIDCTPKQYTSVWLAPRVSRLIWPRRRYMEIWIDLFLSNTQVGISWEESADHDRWRNSAYCGRRYSFYCSRSRHEYEMNLTFSSSGSKSTKSDDGIANCIFLRPIYRVEQKKWR